MRNLSNIKKLADFIESKLNDETFNYGIWFKVTDKDNHPIVNKTSGYGVSEVTSLSDLLKHPCGSQGCVAGWCCILAADEAGQTVVSTAIGCDAWAKGREWLGLTENEANILFLASWSRFGYSTRRMEVVEYLRETVLADMPIEHYFGVVSDD